MKHLYRIWTAFAMTLIARTASADQTPVEKPVVPQNQTVTVELALLRSHSLQLTYRLPTTCRELPLRSPYSVEQMKEMRKSWKPTNGCGYEKDGNIFLTDSQCDRISFEVPVAATMADRVYPPAFPVSTLGVYVHTGVYSPTNACGAITWQLRSEGGNVVYAGESRGETVSVPETDSDASYMAAYLSESPLPPGEKAVLSPELPNWVRSNLTEATRAVENGYRARFRGLAYPAPFVVATSVSTQGSPRQQAEVAAGNMIRYTFFNYSNEPAPQNLANLRGTIAHEYGHKLQPETLRKASGESDNLIHEGGAEYLRWSSMIDLGWFSAADAEKDLDTALNTCLAIIGDQPWKQVEDRAYGEAPYACGLALHVLLLASRSNWQEVKADKALESLYRLDGNLSSNFAQALECGESAHCRAQWLPALLSNNVGFASELDKLIRSSGLAKLRLTKPSMPLQQKVAVAAMMHLMAGDCHGTSGFYLRDQGFEVGMSPSCKAFNEGMMLTHANGASLTTEPLKAARGLVAQCAARHSATVGLSDGSSFEVQCRSLAAVAPYFYQLDVRKILKRLSYRFKDSAE